MRRGGPPGRAGADLVEHRALSGPAAYRSSMCSRTGDAGEGGPGAAADESGVLGRLGAAIDELAAAAGGDEDITDRLARVWGMLAALDPELARRLAGY